MCVGGEGVLVLIALFREQLVAFPFCSVFVFEQLFVIIVNDLVSIKNYKYYKFVE